MFLVKQNRNDFVHNLILSILYEKNVCVCSNIAYLLLLFNVHTITSDGVFYSEPCILVLILCTRLPKLLFSILKVEFHCYLLSFRFQIAGWQSPVSISRGHKGGHWQNFLFASFPVRILCVFSVFLSLCFLHTIVWRKECKTGL